MKNRINILKFKLIIVFVLSILFATNYTYATHNRAGEITYRLIDESNPYRFEFTLYTYTYTKSPATHTRDFLEISWGDNTKEDIPRNAKEIIQLPGDIQVNKYYGTHTFPGPGFYEVVMSDPNRNLNVANIPNSVEVVFTIKTTVLINPQIGENNSPIMLNRPVDKAIKDFKFVHNPAAFDPDGDSLSYRLVTCLGEGGKEIDGYTLPPASKSIYVDPITGDFVWDAPNTIGIYNVAMAIDEWRNGVKISTIIRDMQIEVKETDVDPPTLLAPEYICVFAGDTIDFVAAAFSNLKKFSPIEISVTGAPFTFKDSPAEVEFLNMGDSAFINFHWITKCSHVRKFEYQLIIRAEQETNDYLPKLPDQENQTLDLVATKNIFIQIIAPPVVDLGSRATNKEIILTWNRQPCTEKVVGYNIYRRETPFGYEPDSCITGVPSYTGYKLINQVKNPNALTYKDDKNGVGLWHGMTYCYIVTTFYADGAESVASDERCDELVRGIPIMTNVNVLRTSTQNGRVEIKWLQPTVFDRGDAPGPYQYIVFRSPGIKGAKLRPIGTLNNITDTTFIDENVNDADTSLTYQIAFMNNQPNNRFEIGTPEYSTDVFLDIKPAGEQLTIVINSNTAWKENEWVLYRYANVSNAFDSISPNPLFDSLTTIVNGKTKQYVDKFLQNERTYCYYAKSIGQYDSKSILRPLINYSQIACGVPLDTIPPCQPPMTVNSMCDDKKNVITWSNPNYSCSEDAVRYNLYFSPTINGKMTLLYTTTDLKDTVFVHSRRDENDTSKVISLAGCYAVTAQDKYKNESKIESRICTDVCTDYDLPDIFTPNADGKNELYHPILPYNFVEKIDMKIYNRWGSLMFETKDPNINWNGTSKSSKLPVSDGIYFYVCDVYEYRLTGLVARTLSGFIQVLSSKSIEKP